MKKKFQIGDLVQFDFSHSLGIIVDIKDTKAIFFHEDLSDVLVCWSDGEIFWCMEFTLSHFSND